MEVEDPSGTALTTLARLKKKKKLPNIFTTVIMDLIVFFFSFARSAIMNGITTLSLLNSRKSIYI